MAQSITAPGKPAGPPKGDHNLSRDDEQALLIHHFDKLRQQESKVAEAKGVLDAERATMNDLFAKAKGDKFTRKELQALLDDTKSLRRDLVAEEERRAKLRGFLGLPAGTQADLFASTPSEVRDEMDAEGQGYSMGLRGDAPEMPEGMPARFATAFRRGWDAGQDKLAWGLAAAGKIVDRAADASSKPVQLEPEPDEGDDGEELTEAAITAQAKALKQKGFTAKSTAREPATV